MSENENVTDWPVSTTGGDKINGREAAEILKVSYSSLFLYVERGALLRAEKKRRGLRKQPLVFFLADVVALALDHEKISQEEANELLHPNTAAAIVAA